MPRKLVMIWLGSRKFGGLATRLPAFIPCVVSPFTARAAAAKPVGSVAVVFELMTHCQDDDVGCILDLVQHDVTSSAERDQQLTKESTVARLPMQR